MAPPPKIRTYSNFLTPLLHRRFSRGAAVLMLLCYVDSLLLGQWDSFFWSWFPLGKAGLRTGLLFICAFSIFVLRVSQLHVGIRTTYSGWATMRQKGLWTDAVHTAMWYLFSGWLFSEIYIFCAPGDANINWITDAKNNERPRLNERPIYLTSYFLILALVQTGIHLYYDYDRVPMPTRKMLPEIKNSEVTVHLTINPYIRLKGDFPKLMATSIKRALVMTVLAPVIYSLTIRQTAWSWCLMFAKIFWNLPKSTAIPVVTPFHWRLLARTFTGGLMLILMWEVANAAFSAYVGQEPLKNDRPITYESRDPNGSLITGLKGKKLQTRAYAFWELVYIAQQYQGRRKTMFDDIDRVGGSSWSQICSICLGVINDSNDRVSAYLSPAPAATKAENIIQQTGLPRLTPGLKEDDVYMASPPPKNYSEKMAQISASIAKANGQVQTSPVDQVKNFVAKAESVLLSPAQQDALTPQGIFAILRPHALQFLQTPLGFPFRQEFRRKINALVLGAPYGDAGIFVDAADSLTKLAIHSLREDPFGNVQRDVPSIIRTFTGTIGMLESLKTSMALHWTDVEKKRESPEVELILETLRSDLKELLDCFGGYSVDMRISQDDLQLARQAIAPPRDDEPVPRAAVETRPRERERQPEMRRREERPSMRQRRSRS